MTLFLTSSPCIIGASRAILSSANGFVHRLRSALPSAPYALFVCADPDDHAATDDFANVFVRAFQEAGISLRGYDTLDHRNVHMAEHLVSGSDLIVLSGGHVPTQLAFFHECGLRNLLQGFDGTVMGISAGSMNAAETVYAQPENPGESIDPEYVRFDQGLGLTDVQILPHYQQVKDNLLDGKRLYEDITFADSIGHTFYAFLDGTYLYKDDTITAIYGECYEICNGSFRQICYKDHRLIL